MAVWQDVEAAIVSAREEAEVRGLNLEPLIGRWAGLIAASVRQRVGREFIPPETALTPFEDKWLGELKDELRFATS